MRKNIYIIYKHYILLESTMYKNILLYIIIKLLYNIIGYISNATISIALYYNYYSC